MPVGWVAGVTPLSAANLNTMEADLVTHAALAAAGTHGSTTAATANKLVHRDAAGRGKVVAPGAATDIALQSTVTTDIGTHAALTTGVHGAGADTLAVLGDITRELWVPAIDHTAAGSTIGTKGDFGVLRLDATDYANFSFKVPHDFTTLTHCKVIGIKSTNGTIDWTATTDWAAVGETYATNTDSDTADGVAMTNNEIEEVDISNAFTGLAADEYVGVKFLVDVISAGTYDVIGLTFRYT